MQSHIAALSSTTQSIVATEFIIDTDLATLQYACYRFAY